MDSMPSRSRRNGACKPCRQEVYNHRPSTTRLRLTPATKRLQWRPGYTTTLCTQLLCNRPGQRRLLGARMQRRHRLDQHYPGLFFCRSVVAHAARHDKELARMQQHSAAIGFPTANAQQPAENEEHLVLMLMRVSGKLSLHLRHLDVLIVDLPHHSRRPEFAKSGTCKFKRNRSLLNLSC